MSHGFDLNNPLICEGVIGDGCGGGRLFMVKENTLKAYDPITKNSRVLLKDIKKPLSLSKKACIVSVICEEETINFDLSEMRRV
jgi:hypothetical protein